jgi:hypothetical protein
MARGGIDGFGMFGMCITLVRPEWREMMKQGLGDYWTGIKKQTFIS